MEAADPSFISSSYWTDGIGTSAALASLQKIERENVSARIWDRGVDFQKQLREIAAAHPGCQLTIGGMPPSPSLTFEMGTDSAAAKVLMIRGLVGRGFLGSSQLYLMHAHTPEHIADFLAALDETLSDLEREIAEKSLSTMAGELPVSGSFARLA